MTRVYRPTEGSWRRSAAVLLVLLTGLMNGCLTFTGLDTGEISVVDSDGGDADPADTGDGTAGGEDVPDVVESDVSDAPDSDDDTDAADAADVADIDVDDGSDADADDDAEPSDVDTDAEQDVRDSGPGDGRNSCGGSSGLQFDGVAAEPGDECPCGGNLVCDGLEALRCADAEVNACGSCGPLGVEIGRGCDPCGAAVWTCDGGNAVCTGSRENANLCGGCDPLTASLSSDPGEMGFFGLGWACLQTETINTAYLTCDSESELGCTVPRAASACGGSGALVNAVSVCGACDAGRQSCDGAGTFCSTPPGPVTNVCGGCSTLAGRPGDSCGECGTWRCSDDDESVYCERTTNECGGCGELTDTPGRACVTSDGAAGTTRCLGTDAVRCYAGATNVCGGTGTVSGAPGDVCGRCGSGVLVCAGQELVCDESSTLNACGGCSRLAGSPGSRCAAGHSWVCDGTETVSCERTDWMMLSVDNTPATIEPLVVNSELSLDAQLQTLRVQRDLRRIAEDFGLERLLDIEVRAVRAQRVLDLAPPAEQEVLSSIWLVSELPGYPFPRGVIVRLRVPARADAFFAPTRPGALPYVLPSSHDGTTLNVVLREAGFVYAATVAERACSGTSVCPAGQVCSNGGAACVSEADFYAANGARLCRFDADCRALGTGAFCHDGTGACSVPPIDRRCTAVGQSCFSRSADNGSLACDVLAAVCRQACVEGSSSCLTGTTCASASVYALDGDPDRPDDEAVGVCLASTCDPTDSEPDCDGVPALDNPSVRCTSASCNCQPVAPGLAGCVQEGDRGRGQSCDGTPLLDGRFRCQAGLVCADGTCSERCTLGSDVCNDGDHPNCVPGSRCECVPLLDQSTSPPVGVCATRCEPEDAGFCADGYTCVPWVTNNSTGGWYCAGNRTDGGAPIPLGERCSNAAPDRSACQLGRCVGAPQGEGTCQLICSRETEEGCGPEQFCNSDLSIPDLGRCASLCQAFPRVAPGEEYEGCTANQSCRPINRRTLPDIEVVGECVASGTIPNGEECETDGLGTCEDAGLCRAISGDLEAAKFCFNLCTFDGQITCPSGQVCDGVGLVGGQVASYWCTEVPEENAGSRIGDNCSLEGVICGDGISLCTSLGTGASPTCVQLCALGFNNPGCITGSCQVGAFGPSFPFGGVCLQ